MMKQPRNSNRPAIYAGKDHCQKYQYDNKSEFTWKKPENRRPTNKKTLNISVKSL